MPTKKAACKKAPCKKAACKKVAPKTKAAILDAIAEKAEITKAQAKVAYDTLVAIAYCGAKSKEGILLPGLGKFITAKVKARTGRNPATGAELKIPAHTTVKFRIAKAAKDAIVGSK